MRVLHKIKRGFWIASDGRRYWVAFGKAVTVFRWRPNRKGWRAGKAKGGVWLIEKAERSRQKEHRAALHSHGSHVDGGWQKLTLNPKGARGMRMKEPSAGRGCGSVIPAFSELWAQTANTPAPSWWLWKAPPYPPPNFTNLTIATASWVTQFLLRPHLTVESHTSGWGGVIRRKTSNLNATILNRLAFLQPSLVPCIFAVVVFIIFYFLQTPSCFFTLAWGWGVAAKSKK